VKRGREHIAVFGFAVMSAGCAAHWSFVPLHAAPYTESAAHAVGMNRAYGEIWRIGGWVSPAVWEAGAWIDLLPAGAFNGVIYGASGGQQVGEVDNRATVWNGSAPSAVSLHPPGHWISRALVTNGQDQSGYSIPTSAASLRNAWLWHGTSASGISLHPTGAYESACNAMAGGLQGGFVSYQNVAPHATIWSGSVASAIDLHPPGHGSSYILGMSEGQQVGYVGGGPLTAGAAVWSGTAESYVSLHRPEFGISKLLATCGSAQVGITGSGLTGIFAGIWFGTAESHVSLHEFLPAGQYFESYATSIAEANGVYYVGGYARRPGGGTEAVMWVGIPSPGTAGLLAAAGLLATRRRRATCPRA
jgi:hypothetical protein